MRAAESMPGWAEHNPFSSRRVEPGAIPFLSADSCAAMAVLDRALSCGAVQIVGPHGSGKSTLLSQVAQLARERGVHVQEARGSVGQIRDGLILLDEADSPGGAASSAFRWRRFLARCRRRNAALVVSTHRDLGLPTGCTTSVDLELASRIVRSLLAGWPVAPPREDLLARFLREHDGNLRLVLFTLYDWYESTQPSDLITTLKENRCP